MNIGTDRSRAVAVGVQLPNSALRPWRLFRRSGSFFESGHDHRLTLKSSWVASGSVGLALPRRCASRPALLFKLATASLSAYGLPTEVRDGVIF
jgi:hypothetical protein